MGLKTGTRRAVRMEWLLPSDGGTNECLSSGRCCDQLYERFVSCLACFDDIYQCLHTYVTEMRKDRYTCNTGRTSSRLFSRLSLRTSHFVPEESNTRCHCAKSKILFVAFRNFLFRKLQPAFYRKAKKHRIEHVSTV